MKSIFVSAQIVLFLLLSFTLQAQPCGLQGDGTNGSVASCQNVPTTITYTVPNGCGCQPNAAFFSWQVTGFPSVIVDQNTSFSPPVPILHGNLTGVITGATSTSITIKWDCAPCDLGQPYHLLELLPSCGDFANPIIRIECFEEDTLPPPTPCAVEVSEVTCLKFDFTGDGDRCCVCVRIVFEDGTVLYDIISVGPGNSATLCYEKPIRSYTTTKIECQEWCPTGPAGDDPMEKTIGSIPSDLSNLTIYPNPSQEKKVKVQFDSQIEGPLYFEIVDMTGKVLKTQRVESRKGFNEWSLNCDLCNSRQPYTFVILDKALNVLENKILLLNQ